MPLSKFGNILTNNLHGTKYPFLLTAKTVLSLLSIADWLVDRYRFMRASWYYPIESGMILLILLPITSYEKKFNELWISLVQLKTVPRVFVFPETVMIIVS